MANGIAAGAAPMEAMGSLLAAAPPAPAGPDQALQGVVQDVRALSDQAKALAAKYPYLAEVASQIDQVLKQAVITAAQQQSAQTASGLAVPGGGVGM